MNIPKKVLIAAVIILAAVILILYYPGLRTGFYADDYQFLERVSGSLEQYTHFFLVELPYFRPIQFILFGIENHFFRFAPLGYHLVQVLLHLGNGLLLFAVVTQLAQRWQIGFLSVLFYVVFPVYSLAIFWQAVADPLSTLFYLLAIYFWIFYLQIRCERYFVLTFASFIIALLTKEMNATLFITLLLVGWLLVPPDHRRDRGIWHHYFVLGAVWILYLVFVSNYIFSRGSAVTSYVLFEIAKHSLGGIAPYLLALVAPWGIDTTVGYVWLLTTLLLFAFLIKTKQSRILIFLGIVAIGLVLPLLPFLGGSGRYLYMPLMISGVMLGALVFWLFNISSNVAVRSVLAVIVALVIAASGSLIAQAADDYAGLVRFNREPLRAAAQAYPTVPNDMLFYFIQPPTEQRFLSGMFFLQYGPKAVVKIAESDMPANLRQHAEAAVIYSDGNGGWRLQKVASPLLSGVTPNLPIDFSAPIRLEGYELTNSSAKRGDAIVLILDWRGLDKIARDYTVFVHLVDQNGQALEGEDSQPGIGQMPTSTWKKGELVVDPHILPITSDIPAGESYHIEVGLYYLPTMERLSMIDNTGRPTTDKIVIEPFQILE